MDMDTEKQFNYVANLAHYKYERSRQLYHTPKKAVTVPLLLQGSCWKSCGASELE